MVHISSNVFREDGKFIHTRCFTVDVSEQKKLVQTIRESEARYKSLVSSLPVAIYTCNKEGAITFFNEVAVELWGYRPDVNNMPKWTGKQCLIAIRTLPGYSEIPIIIYTTSREMKDKDDARRLGASYFLSKPASIN